jgi:hypothetical protein
LIEQPDRARLIYRLLVEALDERRGLADRFAATLTRWRALTLPWWQQAVEKGEVDPGLDHSAVVALVLGGLRGIALDWLLAPNSFDLDEAYAMLWRSFARGVAP